MFKRSVDHQNWKAIQNLWCQTPANIDPKNAHALVDFARTQKVLPHLYRCYQQQKNSDPTLLRVFKQCYQPIQQYALLQTAELLSIRKLFQHNDIRMLTIKGNVLAMQLYQDAAAKQSSDIDILIDVKKIPQAHELLLSSGFKMSHPCPVDSKEWPHVQRWFKDLVYQSPKGVCVELHWRFSTNAHLFPFHFERLWQQSQPVEMAGLTFQTLGDQDCLFYLSLHAAISHYQRLTWLADLAQLLRQKQFDWHKVMQQAKRVGLSRAVLVGAVMAHDFNQEALPTYLKNLQDNNWKTRALTFFYKQNLNQSFWVRPAFIRLTMQALLSRSFNHKLEGYRSFVRGRYYRWYLLGIPRQLFWLTYLMEPFFTLKRAFVHVKNMAIAICDRFKSTH